MGNLLVSGEVANDQSDTENNMEYSTCHVWSHKMLRIYSNSDKIKKNWSHEHQNGGRKKNCCKKYIKINENVFCVH